MHIAINLLLFRARLAHLPNARVIFLLGKVSSSQLQQQLHSEHLVHGDILQNTGVHYVVTPEGGWGGG